jgi:hypothetical protein
LINCTVVSNSAPLGAGIYNFFNATAENSVIYDNGGTNNYYNQSGTLNYCCTLPLPSSGVGNITNNPAFVNLVGGNFQLQSNSPCINAGNNAYVFTATDLAGNPRILGGTVDMGAYEYQSPVSMTSYAWLEQYGLPIVAGIDTSNFDGTAFDVWQDWIAGLNPTNPASVLAMSPPTVTNSQAGVVVTWQSVSGITYFLQSSTNLMVQPPFTTIRSNIVGQAGTTSYTDITATNSGPYFYRVGVQ